MILPVVVTPETSAFLVGLVAICSVALLVLYLYLSKKVCFSNNGNFSCCDDHLKTEKCKITRQLGSSYGYNDDDDSSTDSEKDFLKRLYRSGSSESNQPPHRQSLLNHCEPNIKSYLSSSKVSTHHRSTTDKNRQLIKQSSSTDRLLERTESLNSEKTDKSSLYHESVNGKPLVGQRNSNIQYNNEETIRPTENGTNGTIDISRDVSGKKVDLISMAERGKIGKQNSSDIASCSSESGSQDTEEEALVPFLHEKARQKASRLRDGSRDANLINGKSSNNNSSPRKGRSNNKRLRLSSSKSDKENEVSSYCNEGFEARSEVGSKSSEEEDSGGLIKCGTLQVAHAYDPPSRKLHVSVIRARGIPSKERSGSNQVYVKITLTPQGRSKQSTKPKQTGTGSPEFNETFTFNRIDPEEVLNYGVRYRLYTWERMKREHLIGECSVLFATHKPLQQETKIWLNLEPRTNINRSDSRSDVSSLARSDSTGSNHSMGNACSPELLMGLAYNGTTGRLQVSVIRGSQFKSLAMSRAPDTYVKLALVSSSGQEIARSKTSVRRGQPNPTFKETFVFQVALFQLPDVTLLVSVYNKRSMKRKEMIGWFSLGRNSTGEEEKSHWADMRETRGEQIARWHILLDS